ncbi:hypothetical protein QAD02_021144 [Eretmocerus hayati]|uniref:Uncharacterized protein n=1 Tax=Eretmocerus hayati TaxID=131215 RepID=A0ACC2PQU3_9HYME|nr:hypothetical protein QAD02_021144 [Eretmocerus hayati]
MGDKGKEKIQQLSRQRANSLGQADKSIKEFLSPKTGVKRNVGDRSPESLLGNLSKKKVMEGKKRNDEKGMDEEDYMSKGLANIIKEIQNLEKKFDERYEKEREERVRNWEAVKSIAEQIKNEHELKEKMWEERMEKMEKDEERRNKTQEEWEKRLTRIERMIEQKGLSLEDDDLKGNLERWIDVNLDIQGQIIKAWRIKGNEGTNMIGAECESETMKKDVMLNKSKLKGSEIYIENDMTWQQREVRRKLKEKAKEAKGQGKKAVVKGELLIIDSQIYKWNEMEKKIFHTKREWKEKK